MRIRVRLPKVEPGKLQECQVCPYEGCGGQHFKPHGTKGEQKTIRDLKHDSVRSVRLRCLTCGRTFRVYPPGVSNAQQTDRLKAITVLLYTLGLSYGAVADFLDAMGCAVCRTTVYYNVQDAGKQARRLQEKDVKRGGKRPAVGTDGTYVKVKGKQIGVQVVVDDESGTQHGIVHGC